MSVNHSARSGGITGISFRFPLTYHFQYKEEKSALIILNLPLWDFSKGLKNEFETAVVDEPSVFEPLKFYCHLTVSGLMLLFVCSVGVIGLIGLI